MLDKSIRQHILVIGLGISGRSAARFLLNKNAFVYAVDHQIKELQKLPEVKQLVAKGMIVIEEELHLDLSTIDFIILSPGISKTHSLVKKAEKIGIKVIGEMELGCHFLTQSVLGITGTNGKTTVTLLVDHILNYCKLATKAAGNIGAPLTDEINKNPFCSKNFVLELSSYQLETMEQKVLDAALLLNITPDHLDRYSTLTHYAASKVKIASCLKSNGLFFVQYETWKNFANLFQNIAVQTYGYSKNASIYCDLTAIYHADQVFELPNALKGRPSHDLENLMAAYALCSVKKIEGKRCIEAYSTFQKPPHRIQFIAQINGVRYYDDSKGTNLDAVICAIKAFNAPIFLIAGGLHKGQSFGSWIAPFLGRVKKIFAIGQAATLIYQEIHPKISVEIVNSLQEATYQAALEAKNGEIVLLSPGCASQDMFKDYMHRGQVFQQTVQSLANKEKIKNV